ncbi:MAG: DUF3786 domain-containing protein [Crenarchaeota archaeon]|nr:DUF3786 domain-containing protein [Thermoproteota archaeon]
MKEQKNIKYAIVYLETKTTNGLFYKRVVQPVAQKFGGNPENLLKCTKQFGGVSGPYGDITVESPSLPYIPLIITLWKEFPAQASILFNQTISSYLPTEDLAVL